MNAEASKHIIIAGGGLAGLTTAKRLVERGHRVSIFEAQPHLGGRASTFRDGDGDWVEQGLHVCLGAYTELTRLLGEIGRPPDQVLEWMNELRLQDPSLPGETTFGRDAATPEQLFGQPAWLGLDDDETLPNASSATNFEKLRQIHDAETVTDWWRRCSKNERLLERFVRPFCRALLQLEPEQASAFAFLGFLRQAARDPAQLRIGAFRGARDETLFAPLGRWLTDRGATIRCSTPLEEIFAEHGIVSGYRFGGAGFVTGDVFVSALPVWALRALLPETWRRDRWFASIDALPVGPAISVQLWFDRPVVGTPVCTLVANTHAALYAEQSSITYPTRDGCGRISVIVSPADQLMSTSEGALVELVVRTLAPAQPDLATARVRKAVVLKHPHQGLRPLPSIMSRRPPQKTPVPNFFLSGDWTDQPFFGTLEGAVRSGLLCAEAVSASLDIRRRRGARLAARSPVADREM